MMARPPWPEDCEGLDWPRGDCSLRCAMRPAIEVGGAIEAWLGAPGWMAKSSGTSLVLLAPTELIQGGTAGS